MSMKLSYISTCVLVQQNVFRFRYFRQSVSYMLRSGKVRKSLSQIQRLVLHSKIDQFNPENI